MVENKLAKIEKIEFQITDKTAYGRALNKLYPDSNDILMSQWSEMISMTFIFSTIGGGLVGGVVYAFSSGIAGLISGGIIGILLAVSLIWGFKTDIRRNIKETLTDSFKRFEWCLAKAIETFNIRATTFNHWLEGYNQGFVKAKEEELCHLYALLSKSQTLLERGMMFHEWFQKGAQNLCASPKPELAIFLNDYLEAERELYDHITTLGEADGSMAKELLENEVALAELETEVRALLPEKT